MATISADTISHAIGLTGLLIGIAGVLVPIIAYKIDFPELPFFMVWTLPWVSDKARS